MCFRQRDWVPAVSFGIASVLLFSRSAVGQFAVESVNIAHGAVNVSEPADISIRFSEPAADRSALDWGLISRLLLPELGGLSGLPAETGPGNGSDCAEIPAAVFLHITPGFCAGGAELSPDGRTLTLSEVRLDANDRHTLVILTAVSRSGLLLDRPTAITFSTGNSLPSGSVTGTVARQADSEDAGDSARGTVVLLVDPAALLAPQDVSGEDGAMGLDFVAALVGADGAFSVDFVPDGSYVALALSVSGTPDTPLGGAGLLRQVVSGGFDADEDRVLDRIQIADGSSRGEIHITVRAGATTKARDLVAPIRKAASAISPFVFPAAIAGLGLDARGESPVWMHYFLGLDTVLVSFTFGDLAFPPTGLRQEDAILLLPLPSVWMDSDRAVEAVAAAGGSEYLDENPDALGFALLLDRTFMELMLTLLKSGELSGGIPSFGKTGSAVTSIDALTLLREFGSAEPNLLAGSAWLVGFADPSVEGQLLAAVDARSGDALLLVAPGLARRSLSSAEELARFWASDAALVAVSSRDNPPGDTGKSLFWTYTFFSAESQSARDLVVSLGNLFSESPVDPSTITSKVALDSEWLDSDLAMAAILQARPEFRSLLRSPTLDLTLSRGFWAADPDQAVWRLSLSGTTSLQTPETILLDVDARTARVVDVSPEPTPPLRFGLQGSYPNPFAAGTTVVFETSRTSPVRITVHDMLGREVARLVDGMLDSGVHSVAWNPDPSSIPTGVYLYRLEIGAVRETKRLVYLR